MTKLFYICCIVIVLGQTGVTLLRWLVTELDHRGHEVIAYVLGLLVACGALSVKLPFIRDPLMEALRPMFVNNDFTPILYLLSFIVVTTMMRMLFEHFILRLQYSKWEWFAIGLVFVCITFLTFRITWQN